MPNEALLTESYVKGNIEAKSDLVPIHVMEGIVITAKYHLTFKMIFSGSRPP